MVDFPIKGSKYDVQARLEVITDAFEETMQPALQGQVLHPARPVGYRLTLDAHAQAC